MPGGKRRRPRRPRRAIGRRIDPRSDHGKRLAEVIKRRVADKVAEALQRDAEKLRKLVTLGVVDQDWIDDPERDPLAPLARLHELAHGVAERPSMLTDLRLSSIDVLGSSAGGLQQALPDPAGPPTTVVFTDLEGFTSYTEEQGDAAAGRLLTGHYDVVFDLVAGRGGSVVKHLGDGHMLTFPRPRAAVLASLELIEASPPPLRLRAGGHFGPVVRSGDDVLGHVVNLASRVADLADGGRALVTTEVRDRAGATRGVVFTEERLATVRGLEEPVPVCEPRRS